MRTNYMASVAWSSLSLLLLLAYPFNATLISPWLALALPYFWAMASDLHYCGYKRIDVLRVYGFNLILLPVNLAGVVASVVQAITRVEGDVPRTPKVRDRTVAPPLFVISPYVVIGLAALTFLNAYDHSRRENMAYAALNLTLATYAIVAFIGPRNSLVDAWVHFKRCLYVPPQPRRRRRRTDASVTTSADWRSVLPGRVWCADDQGYRRGSTRCPGGHDDPPVVSLHPMSSAPCSSRSSRWAPATWSASRRSRVSTTRMSPERWLSDAAELRHLGHARGDPAEGRPSRRCRSSDRRVDRGQGLARA